MRCPWECYPSGLLDLCDAAALPPDAPVLLTGSLENHTPVVERIAARRTLMGCSAASMRTVRDPVALSAVPPHAGLRPCDVCRPDDLQGLGDGTRSTVRPSGRYLVKPLRGTAGRGIHLWKPGQRVDGDHFLQHYVEGTPISAVFRADEAQTILVGVTEQIIGDPDFGAGGYKYCGSVGPLDLRPRLQSALTHLGGQLAAKHDLRGLFGVDAILDSSNDIRPVEVNPRYTASVEILERATGDTALVPSQSRPSRVESVRPGSAIHGKAIVFARRESLVGDLYDLIDRGSIADVPAVGQVVARGFPICTLLSGGRDRASCMRSLRTMATRLYGGLDGCA